jgi:hypothetical protein
VFHVGQWGAEMEAVTFRQLPMIAKVAVGISFNNA